VPHAGTIFSVQVNLLGKKLKLWVEKVEIDNPQDELYRHLLKQLKEEKK
jgi:hypothetical protein